MASESFTIVFELHKKSCGQKVIGNWRKDEKKYIQREE
jgi:hypothetical protein